VELLMQVRLLGPVAVRSDDRSVELTPPQRCLVFAVLAADAGRLVPIDALIDRVWGENPPAGARHALHTHVAAIRRLLAQAGDGSVELVRHTGGYMLHTEPDQVDLHRFRWLVGRTNDRDRSDDERVGLLREALELWRGQPLAGLSAEWAVRARDAWCLERRDAVLAWARTELQVGNPGVVIGPLTALIGDYPLDESVPAMLMRALYAAGRRIEALDSYAATAQRLDAELAATPGAELRAIYQTILRDDVDPAVPSAPSVAAIPAQLPPDAPGFAGRGEELARLDAILAATGDQPTAVLISAVSGTAGVGKTTLAIHWAHRVADQFPGGQLYVNLRGFDPGGSVLDPATALRGFLDALDVPPQRIPTDLEARTALYRSLVFGRRMLVVLDNARDAEQVRPLLPGTASCLVLVTSRDQLFGLVAAGGARPLTVDLLSSEGSWQLLAARLGPARLRAEPKATEDIITLCARLPLALALVAARASTHPHFPLSTLAGELHDSGHRLDALAGGDPTSDARAVFSWSYRALAPDAARLFRLLGLHTGPDISVAAAASLAAQPPRRLRPVLAVLARAHLIAEATPGRFAMHDLLRAYSIEQVRLHDSEVDRAGAIGRLLDHYLANAVAATDTLHPATPHQPLRRTPAVAASGPQVRDRDVAQAWLDAERANLIAASGYAAGAGWAAHSIDLAHVLARYLDTGGHYADALNLHTHAGAAARRTGDHVGEAHALTSLGLTHRRRGELGPAAEYLHQAVLVCRQVGDLAIEGWALTLLGTVSVRQGELGPAAEHLHQAVTACQQVGDLATQALALSILGLVSSRRGELEPAAEHVDHALALSRTVGDGVSEALALTVLGALSARRGELGPADEHLDHAVDICRQLGDRAGEAVALTVLGLVRVRRGDFTPAAEYLQTALTLCRQVGDRGTEADVLTILGLLYGLRGQHNLAIERAQAALALCRRVGDRGTEADALTVLGLVHTLRGAPADAVGYLRQAVALCRQFGYRSGEVDALNGLGEALRAGGSITESRTVHAKALSLATEIGNRDGQARAQDAIATIHYESGDVGRARRYWQQALTRYTDLGLPNAGIVAMKLRRLDQPQTTA
jgi:DNA-binding SARP family transcriptional activator/tetratricopeptide (TPR) repeat protein